MVLRLSFPVAILAVFAAPHEWRERGLARARLFDWTRCAQTTAALYQAAARP